MLDFEENKKILHNLETKLIQLGESLWHYKIGRTNKGARRKNNGGRFLEW